MLNKEINENKIELGLSSEDLNIDEDLIHKDMEKVFECEELNKISEVHSSHISESLAGSNLEFSGSNIIETDGKDNTARDETEKGTYSNLDNGIDDPNIKDNGTSELS